MLNQCVICKNRPGFLRISVVRGRIVHLEFAYLYFCGSCDTGANVKKKLVESFGMVDGSNMYHAISSVDDFYNLKNRLYANRQKTIMISKNSYPHKV